MESHHEFGCGMIITYIGLTTAFELLWEILRFRGIPIVGLIVSMYTGTESLVICRGGPSSFFPVTSRVRKDCVLALTL